MNHWTEIKISVNAKDIDRASDIANVVVPYGIYVEDYSSLEQEVEDIAHIDLIDEDLLKKDRSKAFVHVYLEPDVSPSEAVAFLSERYNAEGLNIRLSFWIVPRRIGATTGKSISSPFGSVKNCLYVQVGMKITTRMTESF